MNEFATFGLLIDRDVIKTSDKYCNRNKLKGI